MDSNRICEFALNPVCSADTAYAVPYALYKLPGCMSLFQGCPYFKGVLISRVSL